MVKSQKKVETARLQVTHPSIKFRKSSGNSLLRVYSTGTYLIIVQSRRMTRNTVTDAFKIPFLHSNYRGSSTENCDFFCFRYKMEMVSNDSDIYNGPRNYFRQGLKLMLFRLELL